MEPISIYIHIPFCVKKCLYCDFPSFSGKEWEYEEYISVLEKELINTKKEYKHRTIETIFFGGGTPSVLPPKLLGKIQTILLDQYSVSSQAEITLETNPGTLDFKKLQEYQAMGFNRISMGVQAWQNTLLEKLGRIHTIEEFLINYDQVKRAGFQNINLDLMFSLPDQTRTDWEETLEKTILLKPAHLSCYSLIVEEGTPFWKMQEKGQLNRPEEALDRDMYALAKEMLSDGGYEQYEISNFSKPGMECRHNQVYWRDEEYIGFGLGSHSFFEKNRFHNTYDWKKYLQTKGKTDQIREEIEKVDLPTEMAEFMFMGLRMTKGIEKKRFYQRFHHSLQDIYGKKIKVLKEQKLIWENEERIGLTERGIDISNQVFLEFLPEK